jgi:hypothetical protein
MHDVVHAEAFTKNQTFQSSGKSQIKSKDSNACASGKPEESSQLWKYFDVAYLNRISFIFAVVDSFTSLIHPMSKDRCV